MILKSKKNNYKILYILFAIVLIAIVFKLYSPYIVGADSMFHYNRLALVIDALKNGTYPVYMDYQSTNGHGYLLNTFYPDLLLVPFAVIGIFTSLHVAYVSLLCISSLLTFCFTYQCVKSIFKQSFMAYMAALLYTFASYRLFDIFYRGALAEYLAFTFIPLLVLGIYEISNRNYKKWYILTLGAFLTLNTHLITTAVAIIFLGLYVIFNYKNYLNRTERIKYLAISIIATFVLSLGFILPFLEQLFSNRFYFSSNPATSIEYSLLTLNKIFEGLLNNVHSATETAPDPGVGGVLFGLLFVRLIIKKGTNKFLKYIDIAVIIGFVCILANNHYFPWKAIPFKYFQFIQHPTRLLLFVSFIFALADAYYLTILVTDQKKRQFSVLALLALILVIAKVDSSNFHKIFQDRGTLNNEIATGLTLGGAEYLPKNVESPDFLWNREQSLIYDKENINIANFKIDKGSSRFDIISLNKLDSIIIPLTYYKGYSITENGRKINYTQSREGFIKIAVDKQTIIKTSYIGTPLQKISNIISWICLILFFIYVAFKSLKRKNE